MLVARQLAKSFGQVEALRGVSLALATGEIRGVCGENGAGKSTLMKLLMGIIRPDSGAIEIDGRVQTIESPQKAQELGLTLVAQELSLAPDLSVLDNIWLGIEVFLSCTGAPNSGGAPVKRLPFSALTMILIVLSADSRWASVRWSKLPAC